MTNDINTIIPGEAKQDLVDVNTLLGLTVEQVLKLVAASRQIDWGLGGAGSAKSIKDFSVSMKEAADNQQKFLNQAGNYSFLIQQVKELEKAEANSVKTQARSSIVRSEANKEIITYRENIRKSNLEIKNEVVAQNAAIGSLTHLRAELNLTKAKYAELSATVRNSDVGQQVLKQVQFFDAAVTKIENDMGVFARNVGNYNHMSHATMQVMRELPSVVGGVDMLFLGLSNNWGAVNDAMERMRKEGKSSIQIFKAIGQSLFSMNTLISLAVTALVLYGDKLFAATETVKTFKSETEALNAVNAVATSQFSKEATELEILRERFLSATTSVHEKKQIVDKLNNTYGDTIGRLKGINDAEAFFINRSDDFIEALIVRAQIQGAYDKIAENQKKVFEQMEKQSVNAGQTFANALQAFYDADPLVRGSWDDFYKKYEELRGAAANRNLSIVRSDVAKADTILTQFINGAYGRLAELEQKGGFDFEKDNKGDSAADKAAKLAAKQREEWRKGEKKNWEQQFKTQKNSLESEMEANKALAEDERASYETRIDALEIYYDRKRELIDATADYEKWKGTKDAEDIETDRLTAIAELTSETLKIEADAAEDSLKLERDLEAQKIANLKSLAGYNKENADAQLKYDQEIARKRIQLIEKVAQAGKIALDFLADYRRDKTDAELYNLNLQDEENERITAREIARIERSAMSATEKEEAIRQAEAKSDIQRQNIERQRADALQKQASFERDMAIFTIMLDMYRGMSKEIGSKGVQGIVTAAAISAFMGGLLMAANRVAAPKYAEGTEFHPGGPAILGDGGEHELISTPGGQSYWSPATDTLMNLPRGTSVTPMSQIIEESNGMLTPRLMNTIMLQSGGNTRKMEQLMGDVADGIDRLNNKPAQRVTFANGFMQETIVYGHSKKIKLRKRV